MKTSPKFIILFFILTLSYTLITTRNAATATAAPKPNLQLPKPIHDTLLHYATANLTSSDRMSIAEVKSIDAVLLRCAAPCIFLIFGLTHEILLWSSINANVRTVFVNEQTHLVDGPRGYFAAPPGRMAAIFTVGVLARSKRGGGGQTHVFVHEIEREVVRVCSDEFLCRGDLMEVRDSLGHFVIGKLESSGNRFGFYSNSDLPKST